MGSKILLISLFLLIFVVFPLYEGLTTTMIPGSHCCHYHLTINMTHDKFREKYHNMFRGKVKLMGGNAIFIDGSYFRIDHGSSDDSTKTFVTFGEYCYWTSNIHNNRNYRELSRVYYWKRKYLLWKIKSFFAEDMIKFEYETLFE